MKTEREGPSTQTHESCIGCRHLNASTNVGRAAHIANWCEHPRLTESLEYHPAGRLVGLGSEARCPTWCPVIHKESAT